MAMEDELTNSTPDRLVTFCSIWSVSLSATSSGAAPGYTVEMLIKGVEMFGMVSCFMFKPEYKPAATMMIVSNQIASLFFKENLIIEFKLCTLHT